MALAVRLEAVIARHKLFWRDEGYGVAVACPAPYAELALHGARNEANAAPLYYLLEKLVVMHETRFDAGILVRYRLVSLGAAAVTLLALYAGLLHRLGVTPALLALASVLGQPIVHHYAAENRAYMSWLCTLTVLVMVAAEAAARPWRELRAAGRLALAGASLAVSLVATPGGVQAAAALAACALVWRRDRDGAKAWPWLLPLAAAGIALSLLYSGASRWSHDARHLDLRRSPVAGYLVGQVTELFVPLDALSLAGHVLLAGGVAALAWLWRRRDAWTPTERYAFALGLLAAAETALAPVFGFELARRGYFFLPRIFLYLVLGRALLIALGGWLLLSALGRLRRPMTRLGLATAAVALAALGVASGLDRLAQEAGERRSGYPWPRADQAACADWRGRLAIEVGPLPPADPAFAPNFLVRLGEELRRCGWGPSAETRHVRALDDTGQEWFRMSAEPTPGAVPLEQCGRAVVLAP